MHANKGSYLINANNNLRCTAHVGLINDTKLST